MRLLQSFFQWLYSHSDFHDSMNHLENVVDFFIPSMTCLPSFILNYFYFYTIFYLLVYLNYLVVIQWILAHEISIETMKPENLHQFMFALSLHFIQSRSKSEIYVLASKIWSSLSSILAVLFSSSIAILSYFFLLVTYHIPFSPQKWWNACILNCI